jgi:hypothetical protein
MCAGKFPLVSMGARAEGLACAYPGARTPIGASGIMFPFCFHSVSVLGPICFGPFSVPCLLLMSVPCPSCVFALVFMFSPISLPCPSYFQRISIQYQLPVYPVSVMYPSHVLHVPFLCLLHFHPMLVLVAIQYSSSWFLSFFCPVPFQFKSQFHPFTILLCPTSNPFLAHIHHMFVMFLDRV